jgi:hypothetical protein
MLAQLFSFLFFISLICLVAGLIKPSLFKRFIKRDITRKQVGIIFGGVFIVSLIMVGATAPKTTPELNNEQTPVVSEKTREESPEATPTDVETTKTPEPKTTTTTTTKTQTQPQTQTPVSTITISQKNAVQKAKSYLGYTAFSHDGLVAQLEYEQFSHADAVYGADNSGANWNEQASKKAKEYMDYSAFSRGSLIEQLKHEKFTQAEAEYGANAVGL